MESGDGQPMLQGLKVVDLTSVVFGPYCTQILADFGAEVIKIEPPAGDAYRPGAKPAKTPGMGPGFIALNRGKRSLVLDLKDEADAAILRDLLEEADVFIHNVREAAIAKLGFDYDAVRALNPAIIYAHCVGFGSEGRYAGLPAYDDVIQAATGTTSLLPRVDGDTKRRYFPSLIADKVAGLHAVYAVMAAAIHRMRTGRGQRVEVPMFESFASFMMKEHLDGLTFDPPNGDAAYARQIDPHRQPFEMKDGWLSIVPYSLPNFLTVVELMGDPDLAREERFEDPKGIAAALPQLYGRVAELAREMTCEECVAVLRPANVPVMPAIDLAEVIEDPHLRETGFFVTSEHPTEGRLWQMREPNRFSDWEPEEPRDAPLLGQHNADFRKG